MTEEERFHALLGQHLAEIRVLTKTEARKLYDHYQRLVLWNRVLNLTAIRDTERAVRRHYCESIIAALQLPPASATIVDVGSGAGFPGIPIAVLRTDCAVTLVESHQRKATFLKECARDLPNVRVAAERAEQVEGSFDWMISRAVSPATVLQLIPRLSERIILLIGERDETLVRQEDHIEWSPAVRIPWSRSSVVVVGQHVSRGTDCDRKVSRGT